MGFSIGTEARNFLLASAREAVAARLAGRAPRKLPPPAEGGILKDACGVFVSLHTGGALRGCIGLMGSPEALEKTVPRMALEAAFSDPRFPPLGPGELEKCRIEISVLSPQEPCADFASIRIGVHGLRLIHRGRSGVFLPQVPVEQGWDLERYLDQLCLKAGLPPGSHREPGARLFSFTAEVFAED